MLIGLSLGVGACEQPAQTQTLRAADVVRAELTPGQTVEADLDGDGALEQVSLDPENASVTIHDGPVFYRSRAKWQVVQACLGDTDGNGVAEVVTLVDSASGRHLGLFSYFGGAYRERLVTQVMSPAPQSIVINSDRACAGSHDVVELTVPASRPGETPAKILLRWNGFGFTRIQM